MKNAIATKMELWDADRQYMGKKNGWAIMTMCKNRDIWNVALVNDNPVPFVQDENKAENTITIEYYGRGMGDAGYVATYYTTEAAAYAAQEKFLLETGRKVMPPEEVKAFFKAKRIKELEENIANAKDRIIAMQAELNELTA